MKRNRRLRFVQILGVVLLLLTIFGLRLLLPDSDDRRPHALKQDALYDMVSICMTAAGFAALFIPELFKNNNYDKSRI